MVYITGLSPSQCVLGFAAQTSLLGLGVISIRLYRSFTEGLPLNSWQRGVKLSGFEQRINDAYANCAENIGAFAAVVLASRAIDFYSPTLNHLAEIYLGCRVIQSLAHLYGTEMAINVRGCSYVVQLGSLLYMIVHVFPGNKPLN